jgi:hypothetical protein
MSQYYVIRLSENQWLSSILNIGLNDTKNREEALRIVDLNIAKAILNLANKYPHAVVEEINVTVTEVTE